MTSTTAAMTGLAVLGLVQLVLLWRLGRSARAAAETTTRVAQLTSALELLTDAAEEGFVNVSAELGRLGARPLPSSTSRRATTKRIAAAARRGTPIHDIAMEESLSESEVRLHVGLDAASDASAGTDASGGADQIAPPDETPGVLDDIERWMNSLHRPRRSRGARHATVRV